MPRRGRAAVPSRVPKSEKAVRCLMEKTCVLDKPYSDVSHGTIVHEFTVNELTMYVNSGVLKQKHS